MYNKGQKFLLQLQKSVLVFLKHENDQTVYIEKNTIKPSICVRNCAECDNKI